MTPVVRARGVVKSYGVPNGAVAVLRDVDVEVGAGELVVITGPSGSGKTTFLNLISLLDRVSEGRLDVCGEDVSNCAETRLDQLRAESIGMVFQHHGLLPRRSALDNVVFRSRYLRGSAREWKFKAMERLREFDLEGLAHQPARLLSGGEAQRVAVARALLNRPRLLCADEPTGNLDERSSVPVMTALQQAAKGGVAVLVVTHNPAWLRYADRHIECHHQQLHEVVK